MTILSTPSRLTNLHLGSTPAPLSGVMKITMKTRKVYIDGRVLNTGGTYLVPKAWGKVAVEQGWAVDVVGILPNAAYAGIYDLSSQKKTLVALGDSRTAQNNSTVTNGYYNNVQGYLTWACFLSRQRLYISKQAGVGGNKASDMWARYDTDVAPYPSDFLVVWSDLNDIAAGLTADQIAGYLGKIYDRAASEGRVVLAICGYFPAVGKAFSAGASNQMLQLQRWIKDQALVRKNFFVKDVAADIGNAGSSPPDTPVAYIIDPSGSGFHAGSPMAQSIGSWIAGIVNLYLPLSSDLVASAADNYGAVSSNLNFNDFGVFQGTAGMVSTGAINDASPASGFTAGAATGWTASRTTGAGTANVSVGPNAYGAGNVQRLRITGGNAGDTFQLSLTTSVASRLAGLQGSVWTSRALVRIASGAVGLHTVMHRILIAQTGGTGADVSTYQYRDMSPESANSVAMLGTSEWLGETLVPPATVVPFVDGVATSEVSTFSGQIQIVFAAGITAGTGAATIDIGQFSLDRLM